MKICKFIKNKLNNCGSDSGQKVVIKSSEVLIVRTIPTSKKPDYLGNWLINFDKAKNIKYLIGVSGYVNQPKEFGEIIKVNKRKIVDGRVRFSGRKLKSNNKYYKGILETLRNINNDNSENDNMSKVVEELLKNWKGINPTLYLTHLAYLSNETN